jgi:hypothetical protein
MIYLFTPAAAQALRRSGVSLAAVLVAAVALLTLQPAASASALLDSVKQNPALARQMCMTFRKLNGQGQSATSKSSIAAVASDQGLSAMDAEVLITYVIGLNCSEVF